MTAITACYGMNDGRCALPDDEISTTYVNAMRELVVRFKAAGVRSVLLTPDMVDEAINPGLAAAQYNRRGRRVLAAKCSRSRRGRGLGFCARFRGLHRAVTAQRLPSGR